MSSGGYESVAAEEAPAVDRNTSRLALAVSVVSCVISVAAIVGIVCSLGKTWSARPPIPNPG